MPRALHHVALGARDVDVLATFWADLLELEVITRHFYEDGALRSVWLDMDPAVLMIEHCASPRTTRVDSTAGVDPGLFLLALQVSEQEHRALTARLEAAGHPPLDRTTFTSYFQDPEGNRFAISHFDFDSTRSVNH